MCFVGLESPSNVFKMPGIVDDLTPRSFREASGHAFERPRPTAVVLGRDRVAHFVLPKMFIIILVSSCHLVAERFPQLSRCIGRGRVFFDQVLGQVPVQVLY